MTYIKSRAGFFILVAALVLAGCAEGKPEKTTEKSKAVASPSSVTPTQTISKAEFLEKGNAICAESNKERLKHLDFSSPEKMKGFFEAISPIRQKEIEQLKALPKPPGDDGPIVAILALGKRVLAEEMEASKDVSKAQKLFGSGGGPTLAEYSAKTKEYGLTSCFA